MVVKIKTKQLLSKFDYNIKLDNKEIIILTGPNGYGKSTILKMIESFNNCNFEFFLNLDFEKITFKFENFIFIFSKSKDKISLNNINLNEIIKFYKKNSNNLLNTYDEVNIDSIDIKNKDQFENIINEKIYKLVNELLKAKGNLKEFEEESEEEIKIKYILDSIKKCKKNILFISDERLVKNFDKKEGTVINQISDKIKVDINNLLKKHSNKASSLEKTYPKRLLNINFGISKNEFENKIKMIVKNFKKLEEYGLCDTTDVLNIIYNSNYYEFSEEYSKSFKLYCNDFITKYSIYEEFLNKLDLFKKILNEKFCFKKIKISQKYGLEVTNNSNSNISLELLSSGEKQQIIIYYNLIFELKNNTLLLIDEPELSLHIAWQRMFLDDLKKIINKKNVKVIIATHSPQILTHNWNLQVDLGELYGN